ncbi:hypothetical protein CALCODRAFT_228258 [Calocera cornea HHB12733]|uniref:CBM1 domain-containing protein n=1 Tax=Calocera cornea HHB12733 TaxID=1353952 RepID=A0A165H2Z2_9BASI|nr:hypothetical protein CALCODRAFT_228258 [Calocera cornea HHB12733]
MRSFYIALALVMYTAAAALPEPEACPLYICDIPIAWHKQGNCCLATCGGLGDTPVPRPSWC